MKRVKWVMGTLLLAVAVFMAALPLPAAAEPKTNLCNGIASPTLNVATTSGATAEEKAAQKALQAAALIDGVYANGNNNSSWGLRAEYCYSETNPPSATLDLGAAKKVGKWVITGASSYPAMVPANFDIQYSADGEIWQTAKEVRGNTDMTCTVEFANKTAQYWRIVIHFQSKTSGEWSKITEIELYEGDDTAEGTDTTTNWCLHLPPTLDKASTSGATAEEKEAQKALQAAAMVNGKVENGYNNTAWGLRADWHKPQATAVFDLGDDRTIGRWVVTGASSYQSNFPVNYDICYSTDGNHYTTVAEIRENVNYENTTLFSNVTARYWKMVVYFSTTAGTELYRVSEIAMYGGEDVVEVIEKPEVAMAKPEKLTQLQEGETLALSALASCETAEIENVSFYANGTSIADAAWNSEENCWKAVVENMAAGEYYITAKAVTAKGGEAESDSVRIRVHAKSYANIALRKDVTANPVKSPDSNPDALADGKYNDATGDYKWFANDSQANGAWAEIDLDSGFDNMFLLGTIKLYSGYPNGGEQISDFTLYYHNGEEWIEITNVSGNTQEVYTYVFQAEVKASAVKLVSAQNVRFRIRELEIIGKLDDTKLSKTTTVATDGEGHEIRVLEKDTVVCAKANISSSDKEENVDILSLLAVKDGNQKLLTAASCSKTVKAGTSEPFELQATIPEGEGVYCEVLWFDAHTLAPLFPKNTIKSKVQKYSSDEIVVGVTADTSFNIYVKGSDIYGADYVQYPFKHIKNAGMNADLYRIYKAYAVERISDTSFIQTIPAPLLSDGEVEFAIWELEDGVRAADAVGGFHGDENLTSVSLKLDGAEIDLNQPGFYKGSVVEFIQNSTLNRCNKPKEITAYHTKTYTVDKDGVKLNQIVEWIDSVVLDTCHPGMFPVYRTDGVTQVTEFVKYQLDGKDIIYDTRDNKEYYMSPTVGIYEVTIYSISNGFSAYMKHIPIEGLENQKFFFQVRPVGDTKVYVTANYGDTTKPGDRYEWTNVYKLDLK